MNTQNDRDVEPWRVHRPLVGPGAYHVSEGLIRTNAVEINVVEHCNLRCRSCSHLSPMVPPTQIGVAEVTRWCGDLAQRLLATEVRLLGGEPTLHPELARIASAVRDSGLGRELVLITNGLRPDLLTPESAAHFDLVRITTYPNSVQRIEALLDSWTAICDRSGVRLEVRHSDQFRITLRPIDTSPELTERIFSACQMAHDWRCLTLGNGRLFLCPQAHAFAIAGVREPDQDDGVGVDSSVAEILRYLERSKPLPSCGSCTGTFGAVRAHEQLRQSDFISAEQAPEWLDLPTLRRVEDASGSHVGRDRNLVTFRRDPESADG